MSSDTIRVRLGSENTAKLEAVRLALGRFFTSYTVSGCRAPSGVSEQPVGYDEILSGARARAVFAFGEAAGNVDLAVGIEDGLVPVPGLATGFANVGCCTLFDGEIFGVGFSAGFEYPLSCVKAATSFDRVPIGQAFDALYRPPPARRDPGPGAGNIGRLTGGKLTRAQYGAEAVVCALVRFLNPELYDSGGEA